MINQLETGSKILMYVSGGLVREYIITRVTATQAVAEGKTHTKKFKRQLSCFGFVVSIPESERNVHYVLKKA